MIRCKLLIVGLISAATLSATPARAEIWIGLSAPLTGTYAWVGVSAEEGAKLAVAEFNAEGGLLGELIEIITVDDYCAGDQAVAAAQKLIEAKVAVVFGPMCSGAAIPVSKIFAEAGILMISPVATNPKLTEQGFRNVFRVVGRDDVQGKIAGDRLASTWGDKKIAILHDGEAYGKVLAEETKTRLNEHGITEVIFKAIQPRQVDYSDVVKEMKTAGIDVLYYAGYAPEAALLLRLARETGANLQLVGGDALGVEDFGLIAGTVSENTLFTNYLDPRERPEAAAVMARIAYSSEGRVGPIMAYAAIQVWAQAVETAGTFEWEAVAETLRAGKFDTVLGRIAFDEKGDVIGYETFIWYVWRDGIPVPLEDAPAAGE
jgi:branched-chain amino acid transport system substrate-binding protein